MVYNISRYAKKEDFIMKKTLIKSLVILLLVGVVLASLIPSTSALKYNSVTEKSVVKGAEDKSGASTALNNIVGGLLTMVQVVGSGVAVIMLIVLAIKYISAAPSDKAEIKKHAVVYVVGAVVLFAASGIITIVRNFATQNVNSAVSGDNGTIGIEGE